MQISSRSRHATVAMFYIATRSPSKPVSLTDISREYSISVSYLEQIFAKLRKTGLVKSARGPGGGYNLSRAAGDITVGEIIEVFDRPQKGVGSYGEMVRPHSEVQSMWDTLSNSVHDYLSNMTLGQFLEEREAQRLVDAVH